jgi:hypothetical protein
LTAPVSQADPLLLPPGACLLHIGPFKTGSSAIQASLHQARPLLGEHGVVYAGKGARAMRAGWAVIGVTPRGRPTATIEEWARLAAEVRAATDRRVCVSTEDLGRVGSRVAHRVVTDLGPERVHVVTVVRRLDRLIPSQWQQRSQSFSTDSFEDYLHAVLDEPGAGSSASGTAFWASHDVARVLRTWAGEVGPDHVVAIVADETDRTLLTRTFERLLGLPEGLLAPAGRGNASLSATGVELLRRLNAEGAARGWPDEVHARLVREVAGRLKRVGPGPGDLAAPPLPAWAAERVAELSVARARAVAESGVRVVGDPGALAVVPRPGAAHEAETVSIDAVVAGVTGAVAGHRALTEPTAARKPHADSADEVPTRDVLAELGRRVSRRFSGGRSR